MRAFETRRRGFVLLEVMVSVVILSAGVTLAMECITKSVDNAVLMENYTRAVMLAEAKMNELRQQVTFKRAADALDRGGRFGEEFEGFSYRAEVEEESFRDMIILRVEVTFSFGRKTKRYSLVSQAPMARPLEE